MKELGIWEPYEVKVQTMKTAIEAAAMLMRIDDIVSGIQRKSKDRTSQPQQPQMDDGENVRCFIKLNCNRRFPCYGLLMVVCRDARWSQKPCYKIDLQQQGLNPNSGFHSRQGFSYRAGRSDHGVASHSYLCCFSRSDLRHKAV